MRRYVAFLRAINVGGHTVRMAHLRALLESLGLANVETFIASGNVAFESPAAATGTLERRIEKHLSHALGYDVATFLRTPAELAAVVAYEPFAAAAPVSGGHILSIGFLKAPPSDEARQRVLGLRTATDELHVHQRELYWLCRTRTSESSVTGARLEKALGSPATMRNATTVRKLAAKYPAA